MNDTSRVMTNGSWVTMIMKTRAGISGARRAQLAARCLAESSCPPGGLAALLPRSRVCVATLMTPSPCSSQPVGTVRRPTSFVGLHRLVALGHVGGDGLPLGQRLLDGHLPRDRRADVLGDLGADVGELGDVDELDADRRARLHSGVLRVGRGDRR